MWGGVLLAVPSEAPLVRPCEASAASAGNDARTADCSTHMQHHKTTSQRTSLCPHDEDSLLTPTLHPVRDVQCTTSSERPLKPAAVTLMIEPANVTLMMEPATVTLVVEHVTVTLLLMPRMAPCTADYTRAS
eukprot:365165-Chlamydomonas_euryale.AAC.2